jgi:hypothetical protein
LPAGSSKSPPPGGREREPKAALPAATAPAAALSATRRAGLWQIQVGAFRSRQAAAAHLRALESDMPELERLTAAHQLHGRIDRVRIGGIEDKAAAQRALLADPRNRARLLRGEAGKLGGERHRAESERRVTGEQGDDEQQVDRARHCLFLHRKLPQAFAVGLHG